MCAVHHLATTSQISGLYAHNLWVNESLPYCHVDETGANDPCNKAHKSTIPHTVAHEENVTKIASEHDLILCSDHP